MATLITTTPVTSSPSPPAPCPTTREFLNGVDTLTAGKTVGMKRCGTSHVQWSWIRETLRFLLVPRRLTVQCATMGKTESLQITSLPSNQTIFMHGYFVLGLTSMSQPTPDRCMLLSKRFSGMTQHRREI